MRPRAEIYDTTLRDGTQAEGLSPTVGEKLRVARLLDELGVHFIEGGWPGANPKDTTFFARAADGELQLEHATLVAFGMTRGAGRPAEADPLLQALVDARTDVICLVGKSWGYHVDEALGVPREENLAMVADSITHLRSLGKRVFFDAEHFFDGYRGNAPFALRVLEAAAEDGAERLVLCDTRAQPDTAEAAKTRLAMADRVLAEGPTVAAEAMLPKLFAGQAQQRIPEVIEAQRRVMLAATPEGIATNGTDMSVIVAQSVSRGFKGQFMGSAGTWNPGVMAGPAAPLLKAQFLQPTAVKPFASDTPGHQAMRTPRTSRCIDRVRPATSRSPTRSRWLAVPRILSYWATRCSWSSRSKDRIRAMPACPCCNMR